MTEALFMQHIFNIIKSGKMLTKSDLINPLSEEIFKGNDLDCFIKKLINEIVSTYGFIDFLVSLYKFRIEINDIKDCPYTNLYLIATLKLYEKIEDYFLPEVYVKVLSFILNPDESSFLRNIRTSEYPISRLLGKEEVISVQTNLFMEPNYNTDYIKEIITATNFRLKQEKDILNLITKDKSQEETNQALIEIASILKAQPDIQSKIFLHALAKVRIKLRKEYNLKSKKRRSRKFRLTELC